MTTAESIRALQPKIAAIRRDIHAHPELAFAEARTSDLVAAHLERLGIETHRGLAGTGIVARIVGRPGPRAIGLRADMDALPLDELNTFAHRSTRQGCMHACGHDGHTAMLLGAAELLAKERDFAGTVHLIFQPAEEHEGGGRVMVEQGLFEKFPMQMVFGLHNWPGIPVGRMAVISGPVMAGTDRFAIVVKGRGGHAAMPHQAADTVLAGSALVQALQSLVSRNVDPLDAAVVSVTRFNAGSTDNVLPETATLGGTVRSFTPAMQLFLEGGLRRVCAGIAAAHGVDIEVEYEVGYPPTLNDAGAAELCARAAASVLGADAVSRDLKPSMGAEDFAYLARAVPGCYVWLGNGPGAGGCMLHSPHYDFNDDIIPLGIGYWLQLVRDVLA